jgi:GNAT superfamily N-acetyltransferase
MESAMVPSDLPDIDRLKLSDLRDAEALVTEAGWNQVRADWRMFLDFGTVYAVRADKRVVATAAWLPYERCAWISMVLVATGHRRGGIATKLLQRCIKDVQAAGLVPVLDATPAGHTVYVQMGFGEAWGFARLAAQQRELSPVASDATIEPIVDALWPELCVYDARVFGMDRSKILARMRGRLPPAELVARRNGRIVGMLLGRDGRTASHLGPLIAEDDAVAQALLAGALSAIQGAVYIDIPDAKPAVRLWLAASGFEVQRPFTRMLLGRDAGSVDVARTFAVIGPEFG